MWGSGLALARRTFTGIISTAVISLDVWGPICSDGFICCEVGRDAGCDAGRGLGHEPKAAV